MIDLLINSQYMPHGHCINWDQLIIWSMSISNVITVVEYWVIATLLHVVAKWGRPDGHWYGMVDSLKWVFIFCSANYIMSSITYFVSMYYLQVIISWLGSLISFRCIYHLMMIGIKDLGFFFRAFGS